ncbi:hypothetical protein J2M53_06685 [Arthrobacter sp. zg-ZUI100]|uniref:2'-5' RNA ligase family protein n=1 Tax=Arthrobacter jiangjiafuii TaxID=2817475 RepID=UPI001AED9D28|nr:hypothetical protein [Arthrobacter jiangjiafuii]MBP3035940.1 hypothetical protein [Arthrobacter jiangjiafuii]
MVFDDSSLAGYLSGNRRLYAQLRPDPPSLARLLRLQQALGALPEINDGGSPRWVPARQMHLTLIHFGKVRDVHAVVAAATGISAAEYEELLACYVAQTEAEMPRHPVVLEPAVLSRFGRHGRTLVLEYFPSPELKESHAAAYAALETFLRRAGISDVPAFTAGDPNFMFASRLRPHITLARGFAGTLPAPAQGSGPAGGFPLERVRLEPMPVVYPEPG